MSEAEYSGEHKAHWLTISSNEYESMKATLEILSDPEMMKQMAESRKDIKEGRFKRIQDLTNG